MKGICQHGSEHHSEQSGSKDTPPPPHTHTLESSGDGEGIGTISIIKHSGRHPVMKLPDHVDETVRAAKPGHDLPEALDHD